MMVKTLTIANGILIRSLSLSLCYCLNDRCHSEAKPKSKTRPGGNLLVRARCFLNDRCHSEAKAKSKTRPGGNLLVRARCFLNDRCHSEAKAKSKTRPGGNLLVRARWFVSLSMTSPQSTSNKAVVLLVFGFLMFSGCMVGPEYTRPETAAVTDSGFFHSSDHKQDVNELEIVDRWWEHFGDPVIASLVEKAIENNYDLKAAAARSLQSQAILIESRGRKLPSVNYNFLYDRSKRSFNFSGARFSSLASTFSQDITISYVLDLFGKLRHSERAAWASLLATEANQQALTNAIISNVIKARIDISTIQQNLAITRATTQSRERTLEIVERRYGQGLVGPVDVRLGRENLAAARSLEPQLESTLIKAHHALDVLLARRPGSSDQLPESLPDLPNLSPLNIGIPAALLDRRPDVIAAEYTLRSTNEQIGVSIAQLYPDLNLSLAGGRSADVWEDIWIDETEIYSAVFRLAQPIFRGGQLKAQVDASKARFAEAAANYAGTVLVAMKEVEDALITEQMLQKQFVEVEIRLREALAAENLSRQRYQRGVETILLVLETERRRRIAEIELALLKGQIWTTRVNLLLALGGDWTSKEVKS